ncbi:MAG: hypothetical protein IT427_03175 [Pirellulales bacterium]|nr:hypothetical protein [Pirellulales bacterium]
MIESTNTCTSDEGRFWRLVGVVHSGSATSDEQRELEELLQSHSVLRRRYVEHQILDAELRWRYRSTKPIVLSGDSTQLGGGLAADSSALPLWHKPAGGDSPLSQELQCSADDQTKRELVADAHRPLQKKVRAAANLREREERPTILFWKFAGIASSAFAAALVLWLTFSGSRSPNNPAVELASRDRANATPQIKLAVDVTNRPTYVARIVRASSDLAWGNATAPRDFLLRVMKDERLCIESGVVELEFDCGAKIVLTGPATFTPTGAGDAHLESGRLTGEVSKGNFRLLTPNAEVIDLGTSFGVLADAAVGTEVVVFGGRVQVKSHPDSKAKHLLDMTEGMAARIRTDGTAEYGVDSEAGSLVRSVPAAATKSRREVSLVDLIGGGDGFGSCLAGAIDPTSGANDVLGEPGVRQGNDKYHSVDWHPIIDGIFVPPASGGRVQADSLGGTILLPPTNGLTWGPLWARRWDKSLEWTSGSTTDYWSNDTLKGVITRLKKSHFGVVGMHANTAVTLDLRALQLLQRAPGAEFHTTVTNLDNSVERDIPADVALDRAADFTIYVDGISRFSRVDLRRVDGDIDVVVKIRASDRFLTIVSSDSTGESAYDHLVLIDPVILLQRKELEQ